MPEHLITTYIDGYKRISFCRVCGVEWPTGLCVGYYVETAEVKNNDAKAVDKDKVTD